MRLSRRADLRHDTGDFVTEDAWDGESKAVLRQMQVRAAQPGGLNVDHHLSADQIRDTEIFNIEHPVEPIEHCSLHPGFPYGRRFLGMCLSRDLDRGRADVNAHRGPED